MPYHARFVVSCFPVNQQGIFMNDGFTHVRQRLETARKRLGEFRRKHLLHIFPKKFLRLYEQSFWILRVIVEIDTVFVLDENQIGQGLQDGTIFLLALAQFFFGLLALGEINGKHDTAVRHAGKHPAADKHRYPAAVPP